MSKWRLESASAEGDIQGIDSGPDSAEGGIGYNPRNLSDYGRSGQARLTRHLCQLDLSTIDVQRAGVAVQDRYLDEAREDYFSTFRSLLRKEARHVVSTGLQAAEADALSSTPLTIRQADLSSGTFKFSTLTLEGRLFEAQEIGYSALVFYFIFPWAPEEYRIGVADARGHDRFVLSFLCTDEDRIAIDAERDRCAPPEVKRARARASASALSSRSHLRGRGRRRGTPRRGRHRGLQSGDTRARHRMQLELDIIVLGSIVDLCRQYDVCCQKPNAPIMSQLLTGVLPAWGGHDHLIDVESQTFTREPNISNPSPEMRAFLQRYGNSTSLEAATYSLADQLANLNPMQVQAALRFLAAKEGVFLLQGPPGTGKTTIIVGMLRGFIATNQRVLVCTPSNQAVQEIALRLLAVVPKEDMVLLGVARKTDPRLQAIFLSKSHQDSETKRRLHDAKILLMTNSLAGRAIMRNAGAIDAVVMDEAAQASEMSAMIPLCHQPKKALLVGDPMQLGPFGAQDRAARELGLDCSLFDRLMFGCGVAPFMLDTQYRMGAEVLAWPNGQYYDGALHTADQVAARDNPFAHLPTCLGPYALISVETGEMRHNDSLFNFGEVDEVVNIVKYLHAAGVDVANRVGVITPYSAQRGFIEEDFSALGFDTPPVKTVDGFQGGECDMIILSLVRSKKLGFLDDPRRLNVALTRAKYSLIVLGNASKLKILGSDVGAMVEDAEARGVIFPSRVVRDLPNPRPVAGPADAGLFSSSGSDCDDGDLVAAAAVDTAEYGSFRQWLLNPVHKYKQ